MTHSIVWFDLPTKDLERAARFYSKVLGCELKVIECPGGKIVVLPHEKDDVAGCLIEAAEGGPSRNGVLVYFNCDGRLEEAVLDRSFTGQEGKAFQVRLACIDASYETYKVYLFARKHARVKAVRGAPLRMASPYAMHRVDKHPESGEALKQSFRYWRIDTHYYKDKIVGLAGEKGAGWHLPEDVPKDYRTQFVSEHKILERDKYGRSKETWMPRSAGRANHFWDCEVYATAAADIIYVWRMREDVPAPRPKRVRRARPGMGGSEWFKRS